MDWESEFSFGSGLDPTQSQTQAQMREAVVRLQQAASNERRSPEILPFEAEAVETVQTVLRQQELQLESRRQEDREVYQLDIDRVVYLLKLYLRVRAMKLNAFHRHYADNPEFLSPPELRLARKLNALEQKHLTDSFLHCLPAENHFQSVTRDPEMSMVAEPDFLNAFCFYRVRGHVGDVAIETGTINLEDHGVYLGKYTHIRTLLLQGRVELV